MAYSFWVLVEEDRLPAPKALARKLKQAGFPLRIDTDWSWQTLSGWMPMHWDGEDSGCEVGIEALENDASAVAARAGFPDVDTAVILTTRGWDSLKSATTFAACLAEASGGCIQEGEDEFVSPDAATEWARLGIAAADRAEHEESRRRSARESAADSGDLARRLEQALDSMRGQRVEKALLINEKLAVYADSGHFVAGSRWKLTLNGAVFDVSRKRAVAERRYQVMLAYAREQVDADELDRVEAEERAAGELDQGDMNAALPYLREWGQKVSIVKAIFKSPHSVEIVLSTDDRATIEFMGSGFLADITVGSPDMTFSIGDDIRLQ